MDNVSQRGGATSDVPGIAPAPNLVLPCAAAMLSLFVCALSASTLPAVLLRAAADFRIAPETLAYTTTFQFIGFFLSTVAGGIVSDFWGKRPVFLLACGLMLAGACVWAAAGGLATACVGGTLMGMGGGILEGMSSALVADLFPTRRRLFMNILQVMYCIGACGGPFLIGFLLPRGVRWPVFFLGTAFFAAVLFLLYLRSFIPRPASREGWNMTEVWRTVREPALLIPCAAIFLYVLSETAVGLYINMYLRKYRAAPEAWAIYSISLFWLAMIGGRVLCALVPERVRLERTLAAGFAAAAAALAAQRFAGDWRASLALFALAAFLMAGGWPLLVVLVANRYPHCSGTAVGVTVAVGSLGCVAAPPLVDYCLQRFGPENLFVAVAVPFVLACGLMLIPHGRSPVEG
ncbi:MAG: hypothetical protein A3K19_04285 [Lentisphaerae bacterium RIFOXYB12_FULL_65_16]|nr:MAG: hypothetical protein A3K19_04285 [Lentisphaerae bacterium RIFOXYB12_FULL_65_16]